MCPAPRGGAGAGVPVAEASGGVGCPVPPDPQNLRQVLILSRHFRHSSFPPRAEQEPAASSTHTFVKEKAYLSCWLPILPRNLFAMYFFAAMIYATNSLTPVA